MNAIYQLAAARKAETRRMIKGNSKAKPNESQRREED